MNYEEKYKEAIESIKRIYNQADSYGKELMEKEFHELRESEDEKIRKEIIEFLQLPHPQFVGKRNYEEWISWLEKQGEQNHTDKVEPKFKVGDLIHNKWSNHSKEIVAVDDCQYTLNDGMPAPPIKVAIKEHVDIEKACTYLEPIFKQLAGYYSGAEYTDAFRKAMEE